MDHPLDAAAQHYAAFLQALGLSGDVDTARRVTEMLASWTSSATRNLQPPALSLFEAPAEPDWVLLTHIPFHAFCEHHMVPFFGHIDLAYLPGRHIAGFSGFPRVIDHLCRKPQLQERLAAELADNLTLALAPQGLLIRITARQLCMELRGKGHAVPCTSLATRGVCREAITRSEVLSLL